LAFGQIGGKDSEWETTTSHLRRFSLNRSQDGRPIRTKREIIQPSRVEPIESTLAPDEGFGDAGHVAVQDFDGDIEGSIEASAPAVVTATVTVTETVVVTKA
jgi:hypothetical protein